MGRVRKNRRLAAEVIAFNALQGKVTPIPVDMSAEEVLTAMPEMGGIELGAAPSEIAGNVNRMLRDGGRVAYIVVNTVKPDMDVQISLILDVPELPVKTERDLLGRRGYAFAYVWNASFPWCSEAGDIFLSRGRDGALHRIG